MQYRVLNQITVSGQALLDNYQYFQSQSPSCAIAPVLKANAYGHGLTEIGNFVDNQLPDAPFICVDSLYEAYELSRVGVKKDIFIMGYTFPENFRVMKKLPFIFSVWDLDSLHALDKYQPHARVHLKLNTGMNRLGITPDQIDNFTQALKKTSLKVEGVYSHLARADEPGNRTPNNQLKQFLQMVRELEESGLSFQWKHLAATAGATIITHPSLNLVRLGLGFYGYSPFGPHSKEGRAQRENLTPALTLTSHVSHLINLKPGDQVGYGGTYQAKQNEIIATLPLGYHEGISRALSNKGVFTLTDGTPCPVVGRVSMNMTTIKIPRTTTARVGDPVTVITPDYQAKNSLYQHATFTNSIPYTVLTSLHSSIRRRVA